MKTSGITRYQAKAFKAPDGRIVEPIYLGYETHRDYQTWREETRYSDGWNEAMDYVFGVNPNKPDVKLVK